MSDIIELEDIVKEAEYIINNNIEDESRLRQMFGQFFIDKMQSEIDNWDGLKLPKTNYEYSLYTFFEDLFKVFIPKKIDNYIFNYKFCNKVLVEFRNTDWGDSLTFSIIKPFEFINIVDENNNVHKRDLINGRVTLETNYVCIPFSFYFDKFSKNEKTIKEIMNLTIQDIEKYIEKGIRKVLENTDLIKDLSDEKQIKIGMADSGILMERNGYLNLYLKIGIGILGYDNLK